MELLYLIIAVILFVIGIFVTRAIFRINTIIDLLQQIRNNLRELNKEEK